MDQPLIQQIVAKVLAELQPSPARVVVSEAISQPTLSAIELNVPVITASLLEERVRGGSSVKIGRASILTPAAHDWLNAKKIAWNRGEKSAARSIAAGKGTPKWQLILQSITPTVKALQDGMKRRADGWCIELVGQPVEAASLATAAINTAERDGVAIVSEYAEIIACRANRNERVRAAVVSDRNQLELTRQHLGVNVLCINPAGRSFIELRNLLSDFSSGRPKVPAGW